MPGYERELILEELLKRALDSVGDQLSEGNRKNVISLAEHNEPGISLDWLAQSCRNANVEISNAVKDDLNRAASLMRLAKPFPDRS